MPFEPASFRMWHVPHPGAELFKKTSRPRLAALLRDDLPPQLAMAKPDEIDSASQSAQERKGRTGVRSGGGRGGIRRR